MIKREVGVWHDASPGVRRERDALGFRHADLNGDYRPTIFNLVAFDSSRHMSITAIPARWNRLFQRQSVNGLRLLGFPRVDGTAGVLLRQFRIVPKFAQGFFFDRAAFKDNSHQKAVDPSSGATAEYWSSESAQ
jgi:hypothetical protein